MRHLYVFSDANTQYNNTEEVKINENDFDTMIFEFSEHLD